MRTSPKINWSEITGPDSRWIWYRKPVQYTRTVGDLYAVYNVQMYLTTHPTDGKLTQVTHMN